MEPARQLVPQPGGRAGAVRAGQDPLTAKGNRPRAALASPAALLDGEPGEPSRKLVDLVITSGDVHDELVDVVVGDGRTETPFKSRNTASPGPPPVRPNQMRTMVLALSAVRRCGHGIVIAGG